MEIKEIKEFIKKVIKEKDGRILISIIGEMLAEKSKGYGMLNSSIITENDSVRCIFAILPDNEKVHKIELDISEIIKE